MRTFIAALLIVLLSAFGCATFAEQPKVEPCQDCGPCLDQDVWVIVWHEDAMHHAPCVVIVHVPKHSFNGDLENCPMEDMKVVGEGRDQFGRSTGFHVVTIKKGMLNNPKTYRTTAPPKARLVPDNIHLWKV